MVDILGYVFLVIFVLTALLTLLSLPDWIKIPENYRKTLFKSLLLEVIGAIIIVFSNNYIEKASKQTTYKVLPKGWVAIDVETGKIVNPYIEITTADSSYSEPIEQSIVTNKSTLIRNSLCGEISANGLQIKNEDSMILGCIHTSLLNETGLFNTILSDSGEISSSKSYTIVKFKKDTINGWVQTGSFIKNSPFVFNVLDDASKTIYSITDKKNKELFRSTESSKMLFNIDQRMIHFYENEGKFYLFRISGADLTPGKEFVHVLQIKFEPAMK